MKTNPFSLTDEVILLTGGGSGLGLGMASAFVAAGAQVIIVGRRAHVLEEAVLALGPRAHAIVHDITCFEAASELVLAAEAKAGQPITTLVNNAGLHLKKRAIETSVSDFQTILNAHLLGAHALSNAVLPGMLQRERGSLLFIASMASLFGIPQVIAYSAAKSAYLGMVRTLACEVSAKGVRVNAIAPGWIDSPMMRKALADDPVRAEKILSRTPMNRFGGGEDIGHAAVFLTSQAARFITGAVLPVDGGVSVGF